MKHWRAPSWGFIVLCVVYSSTVAFFAWGWTTPPLDRVWQLHHELKIGRTWKLNPEDRRLLSQALARHEDLGRALLSRGEVGIISAEHQGWIETPNVTLVRTPKSNAKSLVLDVHTRDQDLPLKLSLEGDNWKRKLQVTQRGTVQLELPPVGAKSELLSLTVKGKRFKADPSILAVKVGFDGDAPGGANFEDEQDDSE